MDSSSRYTASPFSLLSRTALRAAGMLLLGGCLATMGLLPSSASAQTVFTVDATGDGADANVGDGTCATSGGDCTLRAALQEATSSSTSDEIEFDISGTGPHTIQPQTPLPTVTEPTVIDATSEPDYSGSPVVELDGQNAGTGTAGLTITRASTVQGLAVINFDGDGLVLDGATSNTIQSNYIGVAADGAAAGNGGNGLTVENGSSSSLIGPDNVISNNSRRGIFIGLSGDDDNTIYGNRIGTSPDGMSDMGNGFEGVLVNDVTGTTIGGTSSADRNIISGNGRAGIQITNAGATSNTVTGNYIGVASDGTTDLGNDQNGVEVTNGASNNTIGGSAAGAGNVISGNAANGVLVTGSGTSSNAVLGNNIGTNDAGDSLLGNTGDGVAITSGATATIGGTADGAENVIAGNEYEIYISTSNNTVQGNFLGTNADGDDLGSSFNAIRVDSGSGNLIGGSASGAGNVIAFTATNSVVLSGSGNTFQGNYIGTNPGGDELEGNEIRLFGSDHTIGGVGTGEGNTITNSFRAISPESGTGHTIRGNSTFDNQGLGIDINRDGVTANDAGDGDDGINRLQNFPEIQSASYDADADEVTVTYQVPSDPDAGGSGASAYDLTIDFYRTDMDGDDGEAYLFTDTYTTSDYNTSTTGPDAKTITFTPAATVTETDSLAATATDANGNTSELSADAASLGPNVFTVDATGDGDDADAGDGICATSGGDCTLRAALQETNALANNTAGPDEIRFDISGAGPHTIQPQSGLPDVTNPVVIDGSTEPDFAGDPVVAIDGSNLSAGTTLLSLETGSDGSSVRGLSLINGPSVALFARTDSNTVDGCWIGLAPDGTVAGNTSWGLRTFGSGNQIGVPNGQGNVIVGSGTGIGLAGGASNNTVQNNLIGETPSGTAAGNFEGVAFSGGFGSVTDNTIGGTGTDEGNLIAHNAANGLRLTDDAVRNNIRGNRVFDNADLGIDLADDGQTTNDAGDADDGENRLQNFPEIQSASYDASTNEVTVTYQVPSDPDASGSGASAYDLTIDFYRTGDAQEEGEAYLGTDTYTESDYNTSTSGPDPKTITFTPAVSVTESDHVVATATDANGNTSEFSAQSQQLPVELTALEAAPAGDGTVELTWQVASEQNNAGFAVQHQSSNSDTWTKLGFVESTAPGGTTTKGQSYRYSATDLAVGTHRFRLKQVDLDGSTTVTDPVTVELEMDKTLQLAAPAPNPVRSQATLSFAVKEEAATVVTLYNVLGQQVRTLYDGRPTAGEPQRLRLDASGLSSGVYIVRLKAQGQTRTRRVTVVH